MRKPEFISAREAADMIADGSTLCTVGMTLVSASESVLKAIEEKFLEHYFIHAASRTEKTA